MEKIVEALLEQNRLLTQQIVDMAREVLQTRSAAPATPVPMEVLPYSLSIPESEEDARAMHRAGLINDQELKEALKELDFFSDELVVPSST